MREFYFSKSKILLFLAMVFCPLAIFAQHMISGVVTSEQGEPVAGAEVQVSPGDYMTTSDDMGNFVIEGVEDGNYTLTATDILFGEFVSDVTVSGADVQVVAALKFQVALDQVVITGTSNPKAKIESSVAVTQFTSKQIEELAPTSAASLLQKVPGFAVETSGGEVGNNLFARGIPSAGAYEFVQIQEDGMPVFEDGALQFANVDNFFRLDENIYKMEALRGGSGSIFATNAPGGIINFISKTGTNDFRGNAKLSTGDYGLFRTDLNVGGAIVEDKLFFNIGGFYRTDNGVRETGFPANKGGQIKMNLKYDFLGGDVKLYYKHLNDRNTFYLPIPLLNNNGNIEGFPGFDPNFGTYSHINISRLRVPQFGGGWFERNLEDGIHPVVNAVGGELNLDLGSDFSLQNKFRYTNIDLTYNGIFPSGKPMTPSEFATSRDITNPVYSYVDNQASASPAYVQELGFWAIDKQMENFANNLEFKYDKGDWDVAVGYYMSSWSSSQQWNWSNLLVEVSDQPRLLNLVNGDLNPGDVNYSATYNGVSNISWLTRDAQTQGRIDAFYANFEWEATDDLTFSGGLRHDRDRYKGYKANTVFGGGNLNDSAFETADGHGFETTTADDNIAVTSGPYYYWNYGVNRWSGTVAANYKFNKSNATYFRYSNGFRSPIEEAYFDNAEDLSKIKSTVTNQFELGYKFYDRNFDLAATLFYMSLDGIAFTDILQNGQSENKFGNSDNYGIEIDGTARLFNRVLDLAFNGTYQDPKFTELTSGGVNLEGNQVRRIPKFYFTIRPTVNITEDLGAYVSVSSYSSRFADNENLQELPSFTEFGAGAAYKIHNIRFAVDATNLFNEIGLTEGDPRAGTQTTNDNIIMARPILGRTIRASVSVNF